MISQHKQKTKIQIIDETNLIAILISSDFLKMPNLVSHCIEYFSKHIHVIVRHSTDLSCINDSILARIAKLIDAEDVDTICDRKDKVSDLCVYFLLISFI